MGVSEDRVDANVAINGEHSILTIERLVLGRSGPDSASSIDNSGLPPEQISGGLGHQVAVFA